MAQGDSSTFQYRHLDDREIRLIKISATDDHEVNVQIKHVFLDTDTRWKALSYRWGEGEATEQVHLDGVPFLVTPNLYAFMKCMVREQQNHWFFVDAICINQDDLMERATQVTLMGDIYKGAFEVIAWISLTDTPDSEDTIEMMNDVEAIQQTPMADQHTRDQAGQLREQLIHQTATGELMRNKFWSRLWIVQEVMLANRLILHCGYYEKDADDVLLAWKHRADEVVGEERALLSSSEVLTFLNVPNAETRGKEAPETHWTMGIHLLQQRHARANDLRAGKLLPFHEAFTSFGLQYCTDFHDRSFGLHGLARSRFEIDYTQSMMDLYTAILVDCLHSIDDAAGDNPDWTSMSALPAVGNTLLFAFDLDPYRPVVYLISTTITKALSPHLDILPRLFLFWAARYYERDTRIGRHFEQVHNKQNKAMYRAFRYLYERLHLIRLAITRAKLKVYKVLNVNMTAPCGRQKQRHNEWVYSSLVACEHVGRYLFVDPGNDPFDGERWWH